MKQRLKRTIIAGTAAALLAAPASVFAHEGHSHGGSTVKPSPSISPRQEKIQKFEAELRNRLEQQKDQRSANLTDKQGNLRERLDSAKKKACENHADTINRLMTLMGKRRNNAVDKITNISEAVQSFVDKKQLSIADYDDLLAKVTIAKSIAETATAAQLDVPSLDCSGEHPRADVADFKEKRAEAIDAVKAYRDTVKELVKAVRAVTGTADAGDEQ